MFMTFFRISIDMASLCCIDFCCLLSLLALLCGALPSLRAMIIHVFTWGRAPVLGMFFLGGLFCRFGFLLHPFFRGFVLPIGG